MTYVNITITRLDGFTLWRQIKKFRIEEEGTEKDTVCITLTYTNGHDEAFHIKKNELKSIETKLEMLPSE